MPTGSKGEKRPADIIGNAIRVMQTATCEVDDEPEDNGRDPAAITLGEKGGAARAKKLTAEKQSAIAKKAAARRWDK